MVGEREQILDSNNRRKKINSIAESNTWIWNKPIGQGNRREEERKKRWSHVASNGKEGRLLLLLLYLVVVFWGFGRSCCRSPFEQFNWQNKSQARIITSRSCLSTWARVSILKCMYRSQLTLIASDHWWDHEIDRLNSNWGKKIICNNQSIEAFVDRSNQKLQDLTGLNAYVDCWSHRWLIQMIPDSCIRSWFPTFWLIAHTHRL